jgi:hypothetical protein
MGGKAIALPSGFVVGWLRNKPQFGAQYRIFLIIHKKLSLVNCMFFGFFGETVTGRRENGFKGAKNKNKFSKTLVKKQKSYYSL